MTYLKTYQDTKAIEEMSLEDLRFWYDQVDRICDMPNNAGWILTR